jgi:Transposase DDE domain
MRRTHQQLIPMPSWRAKVMVRNRNGLIVGADVMHATGTAEREAALILIDRVKPPSRRITLGADKLYDAAAFITALRARKVTPHVAINGAISKTGKVRRTLVDGRTTQHQGYAVSQCIRKRIEEGFGWGKTIAGLRKVKLRGLQKVRGLFTFTMAAYNLIRIPKLLAVAA